MTPHETPTCEVGVRDRGMATVSPEDHQVLRRLIYCPRIGCTRSTMSMKLKPRPFRCFIGTTQQQAQASDNGDYTLATPAVRRFILGGGARFIRRARRGCRRVCMLRSESDHVRGGARAISDISRPNAARPGHSVRDGVLAGALDPTCAARCPGVMLRSLRCFASCSVSLT